MRVATLNAPGKEKTAPQAYEGMSATTDRTLVVTSSPSLGISPTGLRGEGLFPYPGIDELRKMANGTSNHMGGPMGEAEAKSSPAQVRVLRPSTSTFRAFDKACTPALGKQPAVSLLPRNPRVSRRCGAWVSMARLP